MKAAQYKNMHGKTIRGTCSVNAKPHQMLAADQGIIIKPWQAGEEKYWWHRAEQGIFSSHARHLSELSDQRADRKILWPKRALHQYLRDGLEISSETVIYGGSLYSHFGYFLLESLSRSYFFASLPELDRLPIVFYGDGDGVKDLLGLAFIKGVMEEVGISPARVRLAKRSVRYNTILSMPMTFHDEVSFSPQQGYWMKAAAARTYSQRRGTLKIEELEKRSERAFISRSAISSGSSIAVNAEEADEVMRNEGFDVLHPEKLPISEQIEIFRRYQLVAGMPSSFFHLKMISCTNTRCAFLVPNFGDGIASNFLNIDEALGYEDIYLPFQVKEAENLPKFQRTYAIDIQSFRDSVRAAIG